MMATLVACSSEDTLIVPQERADILEGTPNPNVVVATQAEIEDVVVRDDMLLFSERGHEGLLDKLVPGTVFVGDRDDREQNRFGFARIVKSVRRESATEPFWVVETEPASLGDVFDHAKLDLGLEPMVQSMLQEQALDLLQTDSRDVGGFQYRPASFPLAADLKLAEDRDNNQKSSVEAQFALTDAYFRGGPVVRLTYDKASDAADDEASVSSDVSFRYETGFTYCGEVKLQTEAKSVAFTKKLGRTLIDIDLAHWTFGVGAVPVVISLNGEIEVSCSWKLSASVAMQGHVALSGAPGLFFSDSGGAAAGSGSSQVANGEGSFEIDDGKLTAGMSCEVSGKLGLFFYGALGIYGAITPTLEASSSSPDGKSACQSVDASLKGEVGAELKVFRKKCPARCRRRSTSAKRWSSSRHATA